VGLKTEAAARRAERELIALVEQKVLEKVYPTWETAIGMYLQSCTEKSLTKKSIYNANSCLRASTLPLWGKRLINEITTQDIRTLIGEGFGEASETHRKAILKFIKGVFQCAVEQGYLVRNPAPAMKFKTSEKIKLVLTEAQVYTLLTKAKEYDWDWYPHVATALYTGLRNGELFALTWDKVDLEKRQMLINSSYNNKDGFKSTKSGDDRIVEIATNLLPLLKALKLKTGDSNFVLPRVPRWQKGDQARELKMFLLGIGLPVVRFHDLRATWTTIMLSNGAEIAKVMAMGGWKDMKTMMIYVRKAGINIRGITDRLDLHDPHYTVGKVLHLQAV
jgi:integrase